MELGLKKDDADMFVRDSVYGDFFDEICKGLSSEGISLAANYIANDLAGQGKTADSGNFRKLITMVLEGRLSSRGAKDTLALMFADGRDPEVLAKEKGLVQQSDESALATIAQKVIAGYPDVAKDYKAGKEVALQFLIGKGMMESKGSANPQALREAIQKILA